MERNEEKRIAITRVVLSPKIKWGGEPPKRGAAREASRERAQVLLHRELGDLEDRDLAASLTEMVKQSGQRRGES